MPKYICKVNSSNKFWGYTLLPGTSLKVEWGRIGLAGQNQVKSFGSPWDRQRFIDKKVGEKLSEGYEESSDEGLKVEVQTAQTMGHKNKIQRMEWVNLKGRSLQILNNYDPLKLIYVEVVDSWSKDITRLLISKKENWEIRGGISESNRSLTFGERCPVVGDKVRFVEAVRQKLKALAITVTEAIQTIKFAAVGARNLFDDEGVEAADSAPVFENVAVRSGLNRAVVAKFAALGQRTLDL
jgi:predicted DNA-binding WGR domain protein